MASSSPSLVKMLTVVKGSCVWDGLDTTVLVIVFSEKRGEWTLNSPRECTLMSVLTVPQFIPTATNFVMQCPTADRVIMARLVGEMSKDELGNMNPLMESLKTQVNFAEVGNSGFAAVVAKTHWVLKVKGEFIAKRNVFKIIESDDEEIIGANSLIHALEILDLRKWPELEFIRLPRSRNNATKRSLRV